MFETTIIKCSQINDCGDKIYINTLGEEFAMNNLQEIEAPFYAVISYRIQFNRYRSIEAAFEDKSDLIEWLAFPIRKELEKKFDTRKSYEELAAI